MLQKFNDAFCDDGLHTENNGNIKVEPISVEERFVARAFKNASLLNGRLKDILADFIKGTPYESQYSIYLDSSINDLVVIEVGDECFRS